jgi:uncharacterized iron-regulated membrane protein
MTLGERWIHRPQNVWLRRAIFQIHLWIGIGLGIYVLLISISGSAIVFRNEISKAFGSQRKIVHASGVKLSHADLKEAARRIYPQYDLSYIWESRRPDEATEVWLDLNGKTKMRLFDPYTGKDLGNSVPLTIRVLTFVIDFHVNLLLGRWGRTMNGIGAILTTILALSGAVVWWPGSPNWRNSLVIRRESNWKRLNWNLHSVVGLWTLAFVLVWGVTGIFVVFPKPFEEAVNFFSPLQLYRLEESSPQPVGKIGRALPARAGGAATGDLRVPVTIGRSLGDKTLRWFYYLHFGNFAGAGAKAIWVVFGFAPSLLFVTGFLMWWNRVLSKIVERKSVGASIPESQSLSAGQSMTRPIVVRGAERGSRR